MREIPYSMIQMPIYEMMKRWTSRRTGRSTSEFSVWQDLLNGGVAGAVCRLA